jgi:hypothetical protein
VAVVDEAGVTQAHDGLLLDVPDVEEELDPWDVSGTAGLSSARVSLVVPPVGLAALAGAGHALVGALVEVALVWPGERWSQREVILRGEAQVVEVGRAGEPVVFAVEASPPATSALVGDDTRDLATLAAGETDTAGDDVTELDGVLFPLVLGSPRSVPAYKIGDGGGASNRAVLCGHALADVSGVTVYADGAALGTFTPANVLSGTSAPYAQVMHATDLAAAQGALTWSASNGGIAREDARGAPTLTAADVLRYLLGASGVDIDWARCQRALALLASWPVGLWLDEAAPALEIVREHLLPYLPLAEVQGPAGLYYAYTDPYAGGPEAHLTRGVEILGHDAPVSWGDLDRVRNTFAVRYYMDEFAGDYTLSLSLGAADDALCALSVALYGTRAEESVECPIAWDAATARRILRARAARLALPRASVSCIVSPGLSWLAPGSVVSVTDDTHGWTRARAIVRRRRRSGGDLGMVLDVVPTTGARS